MHLLVLSRGAEALETSSLAEGLRGGGKLEVAVKAPPPASGYQVTWVEIITIYLVSKPTDAVMGRTYNALLNHVIEQARQWYQRTRTDSGGKRPLQVTIRSRIGRLLKAVSFTPEGEQDITGTGRGRLLPPPSADELDHHAKDPRVLDSKLSKELFRASVVFCDIKDSTSLRSKQPKSARRWIEQCRSKWEDIITEQGGTVILSRSDNVAGCFSDRGEPEQHTDRAVTAALAMSKVAKRSGHRQFSKACVRIGVGTGMTSEYRLLARRGNCDVIDTASTLSIVSRDSVLIDIGTRRGLTEGALKLEYLGQKEILWEKRTRRIWRVTTADVEQG